MNTYLKTIKNSKLLSINNLTPGAWISCEDADEKSLSEVAEKFSLDRSILTDVLDDYEAPRLEIKNEVVYVFARLPKNHSGFQFSTASLLVAINNDYFLTFSKSKHGELVESLKDNKDFYTTHRVKLFLQLFSEIESAYSRHLSKIGKQVNFFNANLENLKDRDIASFVNFEMILNEFLGALFPLKQIFANLSVRNQMDFYKDKDLLEDLLINSEQMIERSKRMLNNITNIREAYSAISGNRLNQVMKTLTVLTALFAIPTMITSFYGMNVPLPGSGNSVSFLAVIGVTTILVMLLLFIFKRKKWL
jgi:magnesium transporter